MNRILIEAVPAAAMRPPYDQQEGAGDWFVNGDGDLLIRVNAADIMDPDAFLMALHELVEMRLCLQQNIPQEVVDAFDAEYEGVGEPGDDPRCPYRHAHRRACLVEFLVADMLGITDYGTIE
jgi:hypothetical protein